MSTVATTRATLTQHALSSPSSPLPALAATPINSSVTTPLTTTTPLSALVTPSNTCAPILVEQLCALRRFQSDMHPDCMLLQAHGVTSPRLSPSVSALAGEKQRRQSEALSIEMEREEAADGERCEEMDSADEMDVVGADDEQGDVGRVLAAAPNTKTDITTSADCDGEGVAEGEMEEEEDDEAVSLCSEDSELSVGQEEGGSVMSTKARQMATSFCDFTQQRRILLSNVGNMMALCTPSAFSSVQAAASAACADGSDARSSASTDDTNTQMAADEESIGSSTGLTIQQTALPLPPPHSTVIDPYNVMANALRMPVPVMPRVSTQTTHSPFQAELMRKSHLYAEELMKQQMQFMAAARASAFTLRGTNAADVSAVERRAFARVQSASQQQIPNLAAGIQSQLTAITKMSQLSAAAAAAAVAVAAVANNNQPAHHAHHQQQQQHKTNLPNNTDALTKFGAALTPAPAHLLPNHASGAISSLSQLQAQMQAHFPYAHSNHVHNNNNNNLNHNNNLNEPALKFSIDNILKADFGRRLAEGAACIAAYNNGTRAAKMSSAVNNNNTTQRSRKTLTSLSAANAPSSAGAVKSPIAIDLTNLGSASTASATAPSSATLSFSHTLANICTNSSDSNSTAVSSSYGGASENAKSPGSAAAAANGDFGAFSATKCATSAAAELSAKASDEMNGSSGNKSSGTGASGSGPIVWPAWVYCTRYSDRPSSGRSPRTRKPKKLAGEKGSSSTASNGSGSGGSSAATAEDKRPRTAFSGSQLARLKHEFTESRYLTEKRRQQLSSELGLNEAQIKIWFQNKRAKLKKSSGTKNPLALQLMAQGLYNHSTVPLTREEEELQELQERENAAAAEVARSGGTTTTTIST